MSDWAGGAWVPALADALLNSLWQGALLAFLYALSKFGLARGAQRYVAAMLALLSMLFWPLAMFLWELSKSSNALEVAAYWTGGRLTWLSESRGQPGLHMLSDWRAIIVALWLFGMLLSSLWMLSGWMRLRWRLRVATPWPALSPAVEDMAQRLGLKMAVGVRVCAGVASPLLMGLWRPFIVVPIAMIESWPTAAVEAMLAHELAHLRRRDPWLNALQSVVEIVLFFHPAAHWLGAELRREREIDCDALVVQRAQADRGAYTQGLLALAEADIAVPHAGVLAATGGALLERVELMHRSKPEKSGFAVSFPGWILGALLVMWVLRPQPVQAWLPPPVIGIFPVTALAWSGLELRMPQLPEVSMRPGHIQWVMQSEKDIEQGVIRPAHVLMSKALRISEPDVGDVAVPSMAWSRTVTAIAKASRDEASHPGGVGHVVRPAYPPHALAAGIQGWVRLSYLVGADGRAEGVRIIASQPSEVFDQAALRALQASRFDASTSRHELVFRFELGVEQGTEARSRIRHWQQCDIPTGSLICRSAGANP